MILAYHIDQLKLENSPSELEVGLETELAREWRQNFTIVGAVSGEEDTLKQGLETAMFVRI